MSILFIIKNGIARGVNYLKNRGAGGVTVMDNTPGDMDNIGKNAGCLIYTSLAHPELIASIQCNFWPLPSGNYGEST